MRDTEEYKYEWWLAGMRPLTDDKKRALVEHWGSAREVYNGIYYIEERQKKQLHFLKAEEIDRLQNWARTQDVEKLYEQGQRLGVRLVTWFDEAYPKRLKNLIKMPYGIYVKGKLPAEDRPTAAIVGARRCTPYGEELSIIHAENLALAGVQVISGMARGVDSISQRAAIEAGGESYGVLGCGVDVCYPKENKGLYMDLQKHGGILSELPPGTAPLREYFPARNRMISGLADMILVMEAKEKSGSLITAAFALDQGKTIYALPGPVTSELSKGCNRIISDGAVPLLSPKYLLEQEDLKLLKNHTNSPSDRVKNEKVLESPEKLLYATVGLFPKSLDTLQAESGMKRTDMVHALVSLEMKGYIREISRNHFVKA